MPRIIGGFYAIPLRVTLTEQKPAWATVREWREVLRGGHRDMGVLYREKFLPQHFESGAAAKYRYRRRTAKYLKKKETMAKHGFAEEDGKRDLVLSGLFRRSVLNYSDVRGYPTRMTFTARAPTYVPQRPRRPEQPPLAEEATRILKSEEEQMVSVLRRAIVDRSQKIVETKKTKIG